MMLHRTREIPAVSYNALGSAHCNRSRACAVPAFSLSYCVRSSIPLPVYTMDGTHNNGRESYECPGLYLYLVFLLTEVQKMTMRFANSIWFSQNRTRPMSFLLFKQLLTRWISRRFLHAPVHHLHDVIHYKSGHSEALNYPLCLRFVLSQFPYAGLVLNLQEKGQDCRNNGAYILEIQTF